MQGRTLQEAYLSDRDTNHFNILRVLAAFFVIFDHSYLFMTTSPYAIHELSIGVVGVDIFFVISGFLVTGSYLQRRDALSYLWARFLRIWPALMVNAVIIAFIMAPLITASSLNVEFFSNGLRYVYSNLFLLYPNKMSLPGVFEGLVDPVLNGVLWTLNYEVLMYCVIGLLGILGTLFSQRKMAKFFLFYTFLNLTAAFFIPLNGAPFVPFIRFTSAFFSGMALQIYKDKIKLNGWLMLFISIAFCLFVFIQPPDRQRIYYLLVLACLSYIIIWLAFLPSKWVGYYNRLGDYSYGLYIYGWPIGHLMQSISQTPIILVILTTAATLVVAVCSWHFLEKKALAFKSLHRKREEGREMAEGRLEFETGDASQSQNLRLPGSGRAPSSISSDKIQDEQREYNPILKRMYLALFLVLVFVFLTPLLIQPRWEKLKPPKERIELGNGKEALQT